MCSYTGCAEPNKGEQRGIALAVWKANLAIRTAFTSHYNHGLDCAILFGTVLSARFNYITTYLQRINN